MLKKKSLLISFLFSSAIVFSADRAKNIKPKVSNSVTKALDTAVKREKHFNVGVGLMLLDYSQSSAAKITQLWTQLEGKGSYPVSENINVEGRSSIGVFTISKSGSDSNLRLFDLGLGLSYRMWVQANEGFSTGIGYQYKTMLAPKESGFKDIHGPYANVAVSFQTAERQSLLLGLGYSFFATDSSLDTRNNEFTFLTAYNWLKEKDDSFNWALEGQIKRLSLNFNNGGVGAYTYLLNFVREI